MNGMNGIPVWTVYRWKPHPALVHLLELKYRVKYTCQSKHTLKIYKLLTNIFYFHGKNHISINGWIVDTKAVFCNQNIIVFP